MIKAIILDVDGVIVGDQPGVNMPLPHKAVIQKFKEVHGKGLPIILCTAKFGYAVQGIIQQAHLNNPHITDGGALVIDPIDKVIVKKHVISPEVVQTCLAGCLEQGVFTEAYTSEDYYQQESQTLEFPELTQKRIDMLQKKPIIVDSLQKTVPAEDIIKIIAFATDTEKSKIDGMLRQLGDTVSSIWSQHPYLVPLRPLIITAPGVTKAQASKEALNSLGLTFDEVLGVGDSEADWNFMEHCGYVATLANGDNRIKELVREKGEGNYFIAPHINDNGMLDILKHFSLI